MGAVAIIPARGGSKRLPRKNILPVLGQPVLFYPVQAAIQSGMFDQVIVSTEDDEIKACAKNAGAIVMDRPSDLALDDVGVVQVCEHVLVGLEMEGIRPDLFCCIYATAVFITADDLVKSQQLLIDSPDTDMVMGVSKFNLHPVQALENKDGYLDYKWPEFKGQRSQHHPELTASNGTFYWARTEALLKENTFYAKRLKGYEIPWIRAVDMDTPEDYENVCRLAPLFLGES